LRTHELVELRRLSAAVAEHQVVDERPRLRIVATISAVQGFVLRCPQQVLHRQQTRVLQVADVVLDRLAPAAFAVDRAKARERLGDTLREPQRRRRRAPAREPVDRFVVDRRARRAVTTAAAHADDAPVVRTGEEAGHLCLTRNRHDAVRREVLALAEQNDRQRGQRAFLDVVQRVQGAHELVELDRPAASVLLVQLRDDAEAWGLQLEPFGLGGRGRRPADERG
jgi:hypothetical protein